MAKELRIISVNFPFKNQAVVNEPHFGMASALFDFDAVVVRPFDLLPFLRRPTFRLGDEVGIEGEDYANLRERVTAKCGDLQRLLEQGGVLVIILDRLCRFQFDTNRHGYSSGGTLYTVSNFDFIEDQFSSFIQNGSGRNLRITMPQEPFARVLTHSQVEWTSFISTRAGYPLPDFRVFAENGAEAVVGGTSKLRAGHIVVLPNFRSLDEDEFLEACREYRFRGEATEAPKWVGSVPLPGEEKVKNEIRSIDEEALRLRSKRSAALAAGTALGDYRKLLFEKGKTHLEPIVLRALDDLGFGTKPSEILAGTLFEVDGRTTKGSVPGILEVKGSQNKIRLDEFTTLGPKIMADFERTGTQSKGVFVGNGLCTQRPDEREGDVVFSPHVLQAAKTQSICLINSVELFGVMHRLLSGQPTELEPIREKILNTSGYADLRAIYGKFPRP